jgi:hypothetical protein
MKIKYSKLATVSLNFLLFFYFTLHDLISGELTYDAKPGKKYKRTFSYEIQNYIKRKSL